MAIKKRTSLRSKARKRNVADKVQGHSRIAKKEREIKSKDALLLKLKIQKGAKSPAVQPKSKSLDPRQPGISKSAVRRRKRKLKEQLTAKLSDLKSVLDETVEAENIQKGIISGDIPAGEKEGLEAISRRKLDHRPNPTTVRGSALVEKSEIRRFKAILKEENFKKSPFASLRTSIMNNISRSENEGKRKSYEL
ncbi:hypothetical protein HII13_002630 [Brettanomyces bruxellensis]|uniref:Ribosome biogenesis protein SLX9 n=1 Tax=Dekkera bruxellensis TaxID=5007 RepID=A0A7D9CV01_DEKBR|nr:hypothetical protein HII13_002630 [Brettanomyces bruxellensis]VUG16191.1 DEBR0S1_10044g1_1 [Brettanomyces bruxellensis]